MVEIRDTKITLHCIHWNYAVKIEIQKPIPKISDRQGNSDWCHVIFQINQLFNFDVFQCYHIAWLNFGSGTIIIWNSRGLISEEISGGKIVGENWYSSNGLIRTDNSRSSTHNIFIWYHIWHVCNFHSFGFDVEKLNISVEYNHWTNDLSWDFKIMRIHWNLEYDCNQWKAMKNNQSNIHLIDTVKSSNPVHIKIFIFDTKIESKDFRWWSIRS